MAHPVHSQCIQDPVNNEYLTKHVLVICNTYDFPSNASKTSWTYSWCSCSLCLLSSSRNGPVWPSLSCTIITYYYWLTSYSTQNKSFQRYSSKPSCKHMQWENKTQHSTETNTKHIQKPKLTHITQKLRLKTTKRKLKLHKTTKRKFKLHIQS